jgi:pyruvate,water dikinase
MKNPYLIPFADLGIEDVPRVGGKNASLGEMFSKLTPLGIRIPDGFAVTADGFRFFIQENNLADFIRNSLAELDEIEFSNLEEISQKIKQAILAGQMPKTLSEEILLSFAQLQSKHGNELDLAVRSSATAEDLPGASFAGLHESFLNIRGEKALLKAVQSCFASLYTGRAIKYRIDKGYDKIEIALSVGVQLMVRADLASSGVCFSIEPESGFQEVILITGCWGLGENIVQGTVIPDEFHVYKPALAQKKRAILQKKSGSKTKTMIYADGGGVLNIDTPKLKQLELVLSDQEVELLANWTLMIENHYQMPMDIEWAKDGNNQEIYIVQARPETVHGTRDPLLVTEYVLEKAGKKMLSGNAVGTGIAMGRVRILHSPAEASKLQKGEVLVTEITNPDWDPIMKKAAAILTTKGGRTSHAAIVAREIGALAIVGAENATTLLRDGDLITLDNSQGKIGWVYEGESKWNILTHDLRGLQMPKTKPMLILGDPDKAYDLSFFPNEGVGLMRMEFIIMSSIQIHPMALVHFDKLTDADVQKKITEICHGYTDKSEYFIDKLSQAIATIAASFYPKEVIVRMSDFKSNEYANLIGGSQFEQKEENPMIGFRGASRYDDERYRAGFELECAAIKRVREEMGLENVKLMIPFCRTIEEGKNVISLLQKLGLTQGENGLEIYVMAEVPSNIILAEEFADIFDGFSIGSNDLTQLTLGVDRDSTELASLFDENNPAVKWMISHVIQVAKSKGKKIGLCGQAPSDNPEYAKFLIEQGIDSISFNSDALINGIKNMSLAESKT